MILVDTNVWSEALRKQPDPAVKAWATAHADQMWLSTVVVGEFLSGAQTLPDGRRKTDFLGHYALLIESFADRIVPFDLAAARAYGEIVARLTRAGLDPGTADCQIAATALVRGMALATRNTKDFQGLGIELIDPWQS